MTDDRTRTQIKKSFKCKIITWLTRIHVMGRLNDILLVYFPKCHSDPKSTVKRGESGRSLKWTVERKWNTPVQKWTVWSGVGTRRARPLFPQLCRNFGQSSATLIDSKQSPHLPEITVKWPEVVKISIKSRYLYYLHISKSDWQSKSFNH